MPLHAPRNLTIAELLERYRALMHAADSWFIQCVKAAGEELRCRAGCSGCCRSLFDITWLDALLLHEGLSLLPQEERLAVLDRAHAQVARLRSRWPDFHHPFLLNDRPQEEWEVPEEDATPCPVLGPAGNCLLYAWRPLTCRIHGIPHIDVSGEVFAEDGCSLNISLDPRARPELRGAFQSLFTEEARLLREAAPLLLGRPAGEMDTFIATALFIDFSRSGMGQEAKS